MSSLEATFICLDNSDHSRNGDYRPTRFESQTDAANAICMSKSRAQQENTFGILTMAGERIDIKASSTNDPGHITAAVHQTPIGGKSDFIRGITTARLALKHRQNKSMSQRIVVFIASPMEDSVTKLEQLGRNLKKNSINLDLIILGTMDVNNEKVTKLINAVNNNNTSHLVEVPVGAVVSDVVKTSAIIGMRPLQGGSQDPGDIDIDVEQDPDLYYAIRQSLLEANQRDSMQDTNSAATAPAIPTAPIPDGLPAENDALDKITSLTAEPPTEADLEAMTDLDPQLKMALLASIRDHQAAEAANPSSSTDAPPRKEEAEQTEMEEEGSKTENKDAEVKKE